MIVQDQKIPNTVNCATINETLRNSVGGPSGIGGWPPIQAQTSPFPLQIKGPHFIECLHEMRTLSLNLVYGEPLSLVQEFTSFNNPIQLDPLMASVIDISAHYSISCGLFHVFSIELCWCQLFNNVLCVQQWGKVWLQAIHIKNWVQAKEWGNVEIKSVVSHSLCDGVRPILEWSKLPMGSGKAFFLQMQ